MRRSVQGLPVAHVVAFTQGNSGGLGVTAQQHVEGLVILQPIADHDRTARTQADLDESMILTDQLVHGNHALVGNHPVAEHESESESLLVEGHTEVSSSEITEGAHQRDKTEDHDIHRPQMPPPCPGRRAEKDEHPDQDQPKLLVTVDVGRGRIRMRVAHIECPVWRERVMRSRK